MGCNESKSAPVTTAGASPAAPTTKQAQSKQTTPTQPAQPSGQIKFTHFGDGGRCEPLLMILAYSGTEFKNEIIPLEDWPALKPKTKMGTLPIMTVGSEELLSSLSILSYLAGVADLKGKDSMEQAACEAMVNMIEDCRSGDLFLNRLHIKTQKMNEETRQEKCKAFAEGSLATLSTYLESNITGSKWLLSKLTAADFWLYGTMKAITDSLDEDAWTRMGPKVQSWKKNFECIPQIAQYLKSGGKCGEKMKLTYFDGVRGRCEPYRMIFAHADVDHENELVTFDEWPALKPSTPMGFLPVLKVGDEEITTSLAILNYLASETGLTGGEEEAECNALVYMIEDCRSTIFPSRFLLGTGKMDEETRKVKEKEFVEKDLVLLNKYLDDHITGDMWLLNKLSIADFWLYGTMEIIEDSVVPDIWSRMSPKVQSWRKSFESLPKVKGYMDTRSKDYKL